LTETASFAAKNSTV